MKALFILLICGISQLAFAQEQLLTGTEIEKREHHLLTTLNKLDHKPKKKRLQEKTVSLFNKSNSKHKTQLHILTKANVLDDTNWEGILNTLKSLQYINTITKNSEAKHIIKTEDYSKAIDSVTILATQTLYDEGALIIVNHTTPYAYSAGYKFMKRVIALNPNYKDARSLMDKTILKGSKNIYFEPVTYANLGNYIEWGSNNASMSSDYILDHLIKDLSKDLIGSHFLKSKDQTSDWNVLLTWNSVNISPERYNPYTIERSKIIKENGQEKTIKATVNYKERLIDVSGSLNCTIKDAKNGDILFNQDFSGITFFSRKEASYTGDKRALTYDDNKAITDSQATFYSSDGYSLTTKMYTEALHNQIIKEIGTLLNWNYK